MLKLENLRFLIVDDVLPTRRVIKRLLTALGVALDDIIEMSSVEEAIEWLQYGTSPCDLIISDFHLGEKKGLDILEFVRNHVALRSLPFLMITNDLQRDDLFKAKDLGVSSYLLKPLSIDNVYEHVKEALQVEAHRLSVETEEKESKR